MKLVFIRPSELILRDNIRPGDWRIDDMVQDLLAAGRQLQPVGVDPGRCVLFGFRRAAALQRIEQQGMVEDGHPLSRAACLEIADPGDRLRIQLLENTARLEFSPIEEAQIIERLRAQGYKLETAAELFRRTKAWASQRLALLKLPADIQAMIPCQISPYYGYLLSRMDERQMRRRVEAMLRAAPSRHDLAQVRRRNLARELESRPVSRELRGIVEAVLDLLRGETDVDQFLDRLQRRLRQ